MSSGCRFNCNSHGTCISNKCICDLGWFSPNSTSLCTINGATEWGQGWSFFVIFFTILFIFLFLYSFLKVWWSLKQENNGQCKRKILRLFKSPKNLSLLSISILSLLIIIWLLYDPLVFKGKSNRMADRLLFESVYPLLFSVLACVLLVW